MGDPTERGGPGSRRDLSAGASGPGRGRSPEGLGRFPGLFSDAVSKAGSQRPRPTVVVRGTLRRAEIEMQPLVLDADDGTTWELMFPPGWAVDAEPGARVTVSGEHAVDVATISMVGPVLEVRTLSRAD